jgi:hypothetical protein
VGDSVLQVQGQVKFLESFGGSNQLFLSEHAPKSHPPCRDQQDRSNWFCGLVCIRGTALRATSTHVLGIIYFILKISCQQSNIPEYSPHDSLYFPSQKNNFVFKKNKISENFQHFYNFILIFKKK